MEKITTKPWTDAQIKKACDIAKQFQEGKIKVLDK